MKFYIDTEFYERGYIHPIQLISIGLVSEDSREYYAEIEGVHVDELSLWLKDNVVPHLSGKQKPRKQIAEEVLQFLGQKACTTCNKQDVRCTDCRGSGGVFDSAPEFWGYFADYDWVLFCQLFGSMIELPKGLPMYCNDLKQLANMLHVPRAAYPKQAESTLHNALADARWNKQLHEFLLRVNNDYRRISE